MSRSHAKLSITERLLLDFIKFKTNNNHQFFASNEKIALALDLVPDSAKVMVNKLVREGYIVKEKDNQGRRHLSLSGKEYVPLFVDLRNMDKKIVVLEADNFRRDAEYYKKELQNAQIRMEAIDKEKSELQLKLLDAETRVSQLEHLFLSQGITREQIDKLIEQMG